MFLLGHSQRANLLSRMLPRPPNRSNQLPLRLKGIWVRTMRCKITKGNVHDRHKRLSPSQLRKEAALTKTGRLSRLRGRTRVWGTGAVTDPDSSMGSRDASPTQICAANTRSDRGTGQKQPLGFPNCEETCGAFSTSPHCPPPHLMFFLGQHPPCWEQTLHSLPKPQGRLIKNAGPRTKRACAGSTL